MSALRTLYDKIFDDHVVQRDPDGTCLLYIDRHLVHEVTSPQAFESKMDMNQGDDFTEDEQDETSRRATKAKGDKPEEAEPAR